MITDRNNLDHRKLRVFFLGVVACCSGLGAKDGSILGSGNTVSGTVDKVQVSPLIQEITKKALFEDGVVLGTKKDEAPPLRSDAETSEIGGNIEQQRKIAQELQQRREGLESQVREGVERLKKELSEENEKDLVRKASGKTGFEGMEASLVAQLENEKARRARMDEFEKKELEYLTKRNEERSREIALMSELVKALGQTQMDMKYRQIKVDKIGQELTSRLSLHEQNLALEKDLTEKLEAKIVANREVRRTAMEQSIAQEKVVRDEMFDMLRKLVREVPSFAMSLEKTVKDINNFEKVMGEEFGTIKKKYNLSTSEMSALVQDMAGQIQRMFGMVRASRDAIAMQQDMLEFEKRTGMKWFERDDLLKGYRRLEELIADRDTKINQTVGLLRNEIKSSLMETQERSRQEQLEKDRLAKENMELKKRLGMVEANRSSSLVPAAYRKDSWTRISELDRLINHSEQPQREEIFIYDDFSGKAPSGFIPLDIIDFSDPVN